MRRACSIAAVVLASGFALAGTGSAGGGRWLDDVPLYTAGEHVDDLPLVAVLRRDDTANFVSFVYGDCLASGDAGCAPPAEIQVWPACQRSLGLYDEAQLASAERITVRGVTAALFEDGTRLELETGRATVVVFADTRMRVLRIAAALRSVDGSVRPGRPLPAPSRGVVGGAMGC